MESLIQMPMTFVWSKIASGTVVTYLTLSATVGGDLLFAAGQVTNDLITSSVGAVIVVVSTLANIYVSFRRKQVELDTESKVHFREVMREQREKDLKLEGKIQDTAKLVERIRILEAENKRLGDLLKVKGKQDV